MKREANIRISVTCIKSAHAHTHFIIENYKGNIVISSGHGLKLFYPVPFSLIKELSGYLRSSIAAEGEQDQCQVVKHFTLGLTSIFKNKFYRYNEHLLQHSLILISSPLSILAIHTLPSKQCTLPKITSLMLFLRYLSCLT